MYIKYFVMCSISCVCFEFFAPLENFSLIWRGHHWRCRATNFDPCSALMAIEQWGLFSVPHLLWHRASVCYGHLWWRVTLMPNAVRLAVELSLPVLKLLGFKQPFFYLSGKRSNPLRHCCGLYILWSKINIL